MKRILSVAVMLILWALSSTAWAIDGEGPLPDPEAAALYEQLVNEVRCLVCQNQTIADSNAPLAADLRREIRRLVLEGQSSEQIQTFLLERYGDFVLYRPRFMGPTALLWLAPLLLLMTGVVALGRVVYRRRSLPSDRDADEEASP